MNQSDSDLVTKTLQNIQIRTVELAKKLFNLRQQCNIFSNNIAIGKSLKYAKNRTAKVDETVKYESTIVTDVVSPNVQIERISIESDLMKVADLEEKEHR